ncbi:MAG: hypothetical protein WEC35_03275 [Nitrosopumilaceae archaeon]
MTEPEKIHHIGLDAISWICETYGPIVPEKILIRELVRIWSSWDEQIAWEYVWTITDEGFIWEITPGVLFLTH